MLCRRRYYNRPARGIRWLVYIRLVRRDECVNAFNDLSGHICCKIYNLLFSLHLFIHLRIFKDRCGFAVARVGSSRLGSAEYRLARLVAPASEQLLWSTSLPYSHIYCVYHNVRFRTGVNDQSTCTSGAYVYCFLEELYLKI